MGWFKKKKDKKKKRRDEAVAEISPAEESVEPESLTDKRAAASKVDAPESREIQGDVSGVGQTADTTPVPQDKLESKGQPSATEEASRLEPEAGPPPEPA